MPILHNPGKIVEKGKVTKVVMDAILKEGKIKVKNPGWATGLEFSKAKAVKPSKPKEGKK